MMMAAAIGTKLLAGGAAAGASAAAGGTALTVARGATTALQAYSQFSASRADAKQLAQQAEQERILAHDEGVAARREVTEINRQSLDVIGAQKVAFAANGIDLGSGSVKAARRQSQLEAGRQSEQVLTNNDIRDRQHKLRAKNFMKQAKNKQKGGLAKVLSLAGGFVVGELSK